MRLLGHPAHPMLVHFPVACWSLGTICDGFTVAGFPRAWPEAALFLTIGLASALPAAFAGFADFISLPEKSIPTATVHMGLMGSAWCLYLTAMLLRSDGWSLAAKPDWPSVTLSFLGLLVMAVGGHYGGQLVYRFGAGVNQDRTER